MIEFLVIAVAAALAVMLGKARLNYNSFPQLARSPGPKPDLTIIIPARNEAHQVSRAIQSFPGCDVLVVDDHSSDETAAVAREAGARVIHAPPLINSAKGKPNACAAGATHTQARWLLFVDADTWFEPAFTESLVAYAETHGLDAATVLLDQQCGTLIEAALLPYAFALFFTGVNARRVNDPHSREVMANGQCLLVNRRAYELSGGHSAVLDSIIEDFAIARNLKAAGLRLHVLRAEHLGHVRMYDSFASIWRGFQKNSFRFLLVNPGGGAQVVLTSALLLSWVPLLALALLDVPPGQHWRALWASPIAALFVVPPALLFPWYRGSSWKHAWRVLLAPVSIYLFHLVALNGMLTAITGRKTIWKERHV